MEKFQHEIGTEALLLKSLLHAMRHLLRQPTAQEKQLGKLERQVCKLLSKMPQRLNAMSLYFKDLACAANERANKGQALPANFFKTHEETLGKLVQSPG